jgi:hypothetical protein
MSNIITSDQPEENDVPDNTAARTRTPGTAR